jgi:hypothetical protein
MSVRAPRWLFLLALFALPRSAHAYLPNEGLAFEAHKGFFAETDVGTMLSVGGRDGYSNAELYMQLGIGVDLGTHLEAGALLGLGTSSVNCFAQGSAVSGTCTAADSFTIATVDGFLTYLVPLKRRLFLTPKLLAGYANLNPSPVSQAHPIYAAANVGAGVGIEYAASLEHFSVGADVLFRYALGADVSTIALLARVKYTF